jgi:hypothetical protein
VQTNIKCVFCRTSIVDRYYIQTELVNRSSSWCGQISRYTFKHSPCVARNICDVHIWAEIASKWKLGKCRSSNEHFLYKCVLQNNTGPYALPTMKSHPCKIRRVCVLKWVEFARRTEKACKKLMFCLWWLKCSPRATLALRTDGFVCCVKGIRLLVSKRIAV